MNYINIEIKAKCSCPEKAEAFLLNAGADFKGIDRQKDTYFHVPSGRLKLRQGNIEQNLIFYNRPDQKGPKQSDFSLAPVADGQALENILEKSLGIKTIVDKERKIFFIENVKFHIDTVKGLGAFIEIEAGNKNFPDKTIEDLKAQCKMYMEALEIKDEDLIYNGYSDM
ncbi:MAG: class IV adenylate cyclase [Chitinophagaceae bacterium]|jgi:predicted adenylyl cyclase CyaB|nr:class IV adenylate cyclase [Chitinophagaceae bacterium]